MPQSPPRRAPAGRRSSIFAATASAAALLAAYPAAAEEPAGFSRIVVFGDSISDGGSYAALAPAGAGRFTTNPDAVWVEHVAAGLGLDLAPFVKGGTNYAEGGARVAVTRPGGPGGLTRTPVSQQIDRFLAANTFDAGSLVIIQGGGNDVFATQANGLDFTAADLRILDEAAARLADQLGRLAAAGAGTIVTTSVPKFEVFNSRYEAEVAAAGVNVLYVDVAALIAEIEASPQTYGIVNVTDPACRGRLVQSFDCLPQDYVTPDANRTYLFADGVHFTGVVHEMQAELVLAALRAPALISQLPYVSQAEARAQAGALSRHLSRDAPPVGTWQVFGSFELDEFDVHGAPHRPSLSAEGGRLTFGADYGLAWGASLGAVASVSEGDGDFGQETGGFQAQSFGLGVFGRRAFGPVEARVTAAYHWTEFDDVTRLVPLGPALRSEVGETEARTLSIGAEVHGDVARGPVRLRPLVGLRYEKVRVDGYAEAGDRSSQMAFGRQTVETLTAAAGAELSFDTDHGLRPYLRATYEVDLLDDERWITVTPSGAPVPFTTRAFTPDESHLAYEAGVDAELGERAVATLGVRGVTANDDITGAGGFLAVRMTF